MGTQTPPPSNKDYQQDPAHSNDHLDLHCLPACTHCLRPTFSLSKSGSILGILETVFEMLVRCFPLLASQINSSPSHHYSFLSACGLCQQGVAEPCLFGTPEPEPGSREVCVGSNNTQRAPDKCRSSSLGGDPGWSWGGGGRRCQAHDHHDPRQHFLDPELVPDWKPASPPPSRLQNKETGLLPREPGAGEVDGDMQFQSAHNCLCLLQSWGTQDHQGPWPPELGDRGCPRGQPRNRNSEPTCTLTRERPDFRPPGSRTTAPAQEDGACAGRGGRGVHMAPKRKKRRAQATEDRGKYRRCRPPASRP